MFNFIFLLTKDIVKMEWRIILCVFIIFISLVLFISSSRDPLTAVRTGAGIVAAQGKIQFGPDQVMLFDYNEPASRCGGRNIHRQKADDMKIRRPITYSRISRLDIPDMDYLQASADVVNSRDEVAEIYNTMRPAYSATEPSHDPLES